MIVSPRRARIAWWRHRLLPSQLEKQAHALARWARREAERVREAAGG
jgi:hypothetical protein